MSKFKNSIAITAGCLVVVVSASIPAAAFSSKYHAKGHHHGHHHKTHNIARFAHKYAARHQYGHRPDCRILKRRAYLTGNAYWEYAAHSCRHDYYKNAY
jgi:hypothetical protein